MSQIRLAQSARAVLTTGTANDVSSVSDGSGDVSSAKQVEQLEEALALGRANVEQLQPVKLDPFMKAEVRKVTRNVVFS